MKNQNRGIRQKQATEGRGRAARGGAGRNHVLHAIIMKPSSTCLREDGFVFLSARFPTIANRSFLGCQT